MVTLLQIYASESGNRSTFDKIMKLIGLMFSQYSLALKAHCVANSFARSPYSCCCKFLLVDYSPTTRLMNILSCWHSAECASEEFASGLYSMSLFAVSLRRQRRHRGSVLCVSSHSSRHTDGRTDGQANASNDPLRRKRCLFSMHTRAHRQTRA